uniref:Uncharacterized protein n=1 Tax=Candidatus Kentrum sp. TUN TaxID=2126343 RepID=A0A451AVY3_9GAMM|nr:MAG: hypothetical protein BECKTUN1418F_GA0071002_12412 [Candidatus Kentron sp. TUN]VFK70188.1 MAG: hypothetical protein BECKTUN1418E_GA0071001_12422 [Candidatus Kentron sp. TUN]
MRKIEESGFQVVLENDTSFRIGELPAYRELSGAHLKEMDVGWWDAREGRLIILELKGEEIWDEFDGKQNASEHLIGELSKKANDTLLILASVWSGTELGLQIKKDLPIAVHTYPGKDRYMLAFRAKADRGCFFNRIPIFSEFLFFRCPTRTSRNRNSSYQKKRRCHLDRRERSCGFGIFTKAQDSSLRSE